MKISDLKNVMEVLGAVGVDEAISIAVNLDGKVSVRLSEEDFNQVWMLDKRAELGFTTFVEGDRGSVLCNIELETFEAYTQLLLPKKDFTGHRNPIEKPKTEHKPWLDGKPADKFTGINTPVSDKHL